MADARLRALERDAQAAPTPEARYRLRLHQARVGALTTAEAHQLLVNALRARFIKRMRELRALPLGPLRVGEDWPQGLRMRWPNGAENVLAMTVPEDATDRELARVRTNPAVFYELPRGNDQESAGWLWLFPSERQLVRVVSMGVLNLSCLFEMYQDARDGSCRWCYRTRVQAAAQGEWCWEVEPVVTRQTIR